MGVKALLAAIEQAPPGPKTAAFFDFDGTIIAGYSAIVFLKDQLRRGALSPGEFLALTRALTSFGLGNLGFSALMTVHAQFLAGRTENTYWEEAQALFTEHIGRLIYPETRALIEAHQRKGHTVAIISSATPYQVEPAARELGIEHVFTTTLEVVDGQFTGRVNRPTCFGEGKVDAAEILRRQQGLDLRQSFFYTDSTDDIQLLEHVGRPVVLNPNKRLATVARERHWPAAHFDSRGRPTLTRFVRSVAATASLVPSFAAGLPIYALTGSRRDSVNFSISLFADAASALINLQLEVNGRENLWAKRPAVFIFNHQSKADVVIMASLLRRDIAGIGKKEIKKLPVIGKVLEMGGVVMIDRKDPKGAIAAMRPLIDAMRDEGKSVVIAPEGTRSITRRLGAFKKGAFHIAMQAGVPIVPVVIHNASDIAPKGDFVFRRGIVSVDVLPPIETTDWKVNRLGHHIEAIRQQFIEVLERGPKPPYSQPSEALRAEEPPKRPAATTPDTARAKAVPGKRAARKKPALARKTPVVTEQDNAKAAQTKGRTKTSSAAQKSTNTPRTKRAVARRQGMPAAAAGVETGSTQPKVVAGAGPAKQASPSTKSPKKKKDATRSKKRGPTAKVSRPQATPRPPRTVSPKAVVKPKMSE